MSRIGLAMATALALSAGWAAVAADAPSTVDVREAMVEGVNPPAIAIWDVGNEATDAEGMPDPAQLDAEKLAILKEAAELLALYSRKLAQSDTIVASGPDLVGGQVPEGVASREQIQAAINADPAGFRERASAMGEEAAAIAAAIDAGDKETLADLVTRFDGACQSCHERYWYVNQ